MSEIVKGLKKAWLLLSNLRYANVYFSQTGEDIVLRHLFYGKKKGFYVDVGAHHPERFSNTKLLYEQGWSGINIEPDFKNYELLRKRRKRDYNSPAVISNKPGLVKFYSFKDGARNTGIKKFVEDMNEKPVVNVYQSLTLEQVLTSVVNANQVIDFFNVDCEGMDLEVLKSNNWVKFRPNYVLVEMFGAPIEKNNKRMDKFLVSKGYSFFCKTPITAVYKKK